MGEGRSPTSQQSFKDTTLHIEKKHASAAEHRAALVLQDDPGSIQQDSRFPIKAFPGPARADVDACMHVK